jgi:rhodanese-related sulfurtransferase
VKKIILTLVFVFILLGYMHSQEITELSPQEAFEMAQKPSTYLIDVRSIAEYVFVGHPEMAYNIPYSFWSEKDKALLTNETFVEDLTERFDKNETLIFLCRSGGRSLSAAKKIVRAGFSKVYNLTQGFEGNKNENGYRIIGGWKNSGVPYTYDLDEKLVYKFK